MPASYHLIVADTRDRPVRHMRYIVAHLPRHQSAFFVTGNFLPLSFAWYTRLSSKVASDAMSLLYSNCATRQMHAVSPAWPLGAQGMIDFRLNPELQTLSCSNMLPSPRAAPTTPRNDSQHAFMVDEQSSEESCIVTNLMTEAPRILKWKTH